MRVAKLALVVGVILTGSQVISGRQVINMPPGPATVAKGTGLIIGQVLDADNKPVPIPIINLAGTSPDGEFPGQRALADNSGRFIFHSLPRGQFTFSVSSPGYLQGEGFGQRRAGGGGQVLDLADGEKAQNIVLRMWRPATLSGTITDQYGDPLVRVEVVALRQTFADGVEQLVFGDVRATDDLGRFHLWRLAPGEYVVAVRSLVAAGPATGLVGTEVPTRPGAPAPNPSLVPNPVFRVGDFTMTSTTSLWSPPWSEEQALIYPTTYHPNVSSPAQARRLVLNAGDNRTGVDIQAKLVRAFRVSGAVTGFAAPPTRAEMRLIDADLVGSSLAVQFSTAVTPIAPDGSFTFLGVPPGDYRIVAVVAPPSPGPPQPGPPPPSNEPTLWASHPVTVTETDVTGLSVALQPGPRVSGRLQFEGTRPRPAPQVVARISGYLEGDQGVDRYHDVRTTEAGEFRSDSLAPGRYLLGVEPPAGWTLKSAVLHGVDVSDRPFLVESRDITDIVIALTDKPNQLSGVVQSAPGVPDPTALVVLVPQDRARWTERAGRSMRTTRVAPNGRYRLTGVPPGNYLVAAVDDRSTLEWPNVAWIESVARLAAIVAIGPDETKTVDLRTTTIR